MLVYPSKMIELLLAQQLYQRSTLDFQAAVQRELTQQKAITLYSPQAPLEQRVDTSKLQYTLTQVNGILARPYLDVENLDPAKFYDDMVERGNAIKYGLNNFSAEESKGMAPVISDYVRNASLFQKSSLVIILDGYTVLFKTLRFDGSRSEKEARDGNQAEEISRLDRIALQSDEIASTANGIIQLMKDKGI